MSFGAMSPSTNVWPTRVDRPVDDTARESEVGELAARSGLTLQKSRRGNDTACGPTLYWLVDLATHKLVSAGAGRTLDDMARYLET